MKQLVVSFDSRDTDLTPREAQMLNVLIVLRTDAMRSFFREVELTREQERHILDDVALFMTRHFPDILFAVEEVEPFHMPPGPDFPGRLRARRGRD
jgi:hypothetical protein